MSDPRSEDAAAVFSPLRSKLVRVAYRMLGSVGCPAPWWKSTPLKMSPCR